MIFKTIIIAIVLVTIIMLALGVKLLFDKNAKFTTHSCSAKDRLDAKDDGCLTCDLDELHSTSR
jgi:hypothetical protein